jgi:hypothetical protein
MAVPYRDPDWLKKSLQAALELELSTLRLAQQQRKVARFV